MVEHLPGIHKALNSILSTTEEGGGVGGREVGGGGGEVE